MGKEYGMQLLDQALMSAIVAKEIDGNDAYGYANDKKQFQHHVSELGEIPAPLEAAT